MDTDDRYLKIINACKLNLHDLTNVKDSIELVESCIIKLKKMKETPTSSYKELYGILCSLYAKCPEYNNNENHLHAWIELLAYCEKPAEICRKLLNEKMFLNFSNFYVLSAKYFIKQSILEAFDILKKGILFNSTPKIDSNSEISKILKKYLREIDEPDGPKVSTSLKSENSAISIEFQKRKKTFTNEVKVEKLKCFPLNLLCYDDNEYSLEELLAVKFFIEMNICTDNDPYSDKVVVTREQLDSISIYVKKFIDINDSNDMIIDRTDYNFNSLIIDNHSPLIQYNNSKIDKYLRFPSSNESHLFEPNNNIIIAKEPYNSKIKDKDMKKLSIGTIDHNLGNFNSLTKDPKTNKTFSSVQTPFKIVTPFKTEENFRNTSPTPTLATKYAKNLINKIISKPLLSDSETSSTYELVNSANNEITPFKKIQKDSFDVNDENVLFNDNLVQPSKVRTIQNLLASTSDHIDSFNLNYQNLKCGSLTTNSHYIPHHVVHEKLIDISDDFHTNIHNSHNSQTYRNPSDNFVLKKEEDYTIGISQIPNSLHSTPNPSKQNSINNQAKTNSQVYIDKSFVDHRGQPKENKINSETYQIDNRIFNGLEKVEPVKFSEFTNFVEINPFDRSIIKSWLTNLKYPVQQHANYHFLSDLDLSLVSVGQNIEFNGISYKVMQLLGSGGFADVYRCSSTSSNWCHDIAIKIEKVNLIAEWEFYVISQLNLRLSKSFIDVLLIKSSTCLGLVFQYSPSITLLDLSNRIKISQDLSSWDETVSLVICQKLIDLLVMCHSNDIIHGDFKPDNILVLRHQSNGFELKVIDFGRSIDLRLCPNNVVFKGKSNTEDFECLEMRMNSTWKYEIDYFGLIATCHVFIFQSYMKPVPFKNNQWKISSTFKRSWDRRFWNQLFDLFLLENCDRRIIAENPLSKAGEIISNKLQEISSSNEKPYLKTVKFIEKYVY